MEKLQESEKNKEKKKTRGYRQASSVSKDLSAPAQQHNGIKMVGAVVPLTDPIVSPADFFDNGKAEAMAKGVWLRRFMPERGIRIFAVAHPDCQKSLPDDRGQGDERLFGTGFFTCLNSVIHQIENNTAQIRLGNPGLFHVIRKKDFVGYVNVMSGSSSVFTFQNGIEQAVPAAGLKMLLP